MRLTDRSWRSPRRSTRSSGIYLPMFAFTTTRSHRGVISTCRCRHMQRDEDITLPQDTDCSSSTRTRTPGTAQPLTVSPEDAHTRPTRPQDRGMLLFPTLILTCIPLGRYPARVLDLRGRCETPLWIGTEGSSPHLFNKQGNPY
jgi:hypothetical protein